MFAKTLEALKAVEVAAQEELDALWVEFDPKTGTGGVHWNAQGSGTLQDLLRGVRGLIAEIEPKQAAHEAAQAQAAEAEKAAAASAPAVDATEGALAHAKATGVDISTVEGTGAGGKVTKADVEAARA